MELMKFMESKCDVWLTIQELSVRAIPPSQAGNCLCLYLPRALHLFAL
jgi:hypothetical protein